MNARYWIQSEKNIQQSKTKGVSWCQTNYNIKTNVNAAKKYY